MKKYIWIYFLLLATFLAGCSSPISTNVISKDEIKITSYKRQNTNEVYDQIVIPEVIRNRNVTTIATDAFNDETNYRNIVLPKTITTLEENAFKIYIYSTVTNHNVYYQGTIETWCAIDMANEWSNPLAGSGSLYIKSNDGLVEYNGEKYDLVKNLVIPNGISEIKQYTFRNNSDIESVIIGEDVTSIGKYAFSSRHLMELKSVTFGSNVKELGHSAFRQCKLDSVILNDGLEIINDYCFYTVESPEFMVLPNSLKKLGNHSLPSNTSLFFKGNQEQWESIEKADYFSENYYLYYLSETEPAISGNYWHYNDEGMPAIW